MINFYWLLAIASFVPSLVDSQEEDPLLLEYSDYYYDLYYGDYDDYNEGAPHATAPRSIRVEKPKSIGQGSTRNNKSNQGSKVSNKHTVITTKPKQKSNKPQKINKSNIGKSSTRREPLNVRLQRLLTADKSSARTILDILEAPASSQLEILKFLRSIVARIEQEELSKQKTKQKPFTTSAGNFITTVNKPLKTTPTSFRELPKQSGRNSGKSSSRPPIPPPTHSPIKQKTTPSKAVTKQFSGSFRSNSDINAGKRGQSSNIVPQQFNQFPNFQKHNSKSEIPRGSEGRSIQQQTVNKSQTQKKNKGAKTLPAANKNTKKSEGFQKENIEIPDQHSPTSSSGLTIEEFLTRYPEVKRLSSRFNNGEEDDQFTEANLDGDDIKQFGGPAFTAFSPETGTKPPRKTPQITPKQRQIQSQNKQQQTNKKQANKLKQQREREQREQAKREKQQRERELREKERREQERKQKEQREREQREKAQREKIQREKERQRQQIQQKQIAKTANQVPPPDHIDDYGADYDYDYYYDQLVPEHERFFQLPKTSEATPINIAPSFSQQKNKEGFQVFTHFNQGQISNKNKSKQKSPSSSAVSSKPKKNSKPIKSKPKGGKQSNAVQANSISGSAGKHGGSGGPQAGPYGYTEKGTFFIDEGFSGFPEKIEMIYQGFVWAFTMYYPDQTPILHGGVHTILKDKVKSETIDLTGDYIVRVTGRASPYNINRFTFYTKQGKKYGPWGDRHSEESVDFDVSAPPGQALAFFSGTIDFGVPLRSVSFHWKPIA